MHRNRRPRFANRNKPNFPLPKTLRTLLEPLEERVLLANPVITEFLAHNTNGLEDNFGRTSDWLEIYNPNSNTFNLGGYYLTDDLQDLNKWQIPTGQNLGGNGYLVVFASGDDIAVANQPLHTNFQISENAGFLALVAPDGTTVVSSYDYPDQIANTSYGIAVQSTTTKYLGTGALAKSFIPANGNLGTSWTTNSFNDNSWRQGVSGVGYETDPLPPPTTQWAIRMVDTAAGPMNTIADATNVLNGTGSGYTVVSDTSSNYPYVNMAGGGNFAGDYILPNGETNVDAPGRSYYALRVTANVTIPVGTWTLDVGSDDGFRLRIPGVTFTNRVNENFTSAPNPSPADTLVFGTGRGHGHTSGVITITGSPLVTTLQLDFFEGLGGDDLEFSGAVGTKTSFNTTDFSLIGNGWNGWSISSSNVTPQQNYRPLIGNNQDLQSTMFNIATSAYIRMPFAIGDPSQTDTLLLRVKYDDGFVAYINGVKVAERNAPATPVWNSIATQEHPDAQALVYEDIVIPINPGLLVAGTNTLAIHGLNSAANDPDFLILPTLDGLDTIVLSGDRYMSTPTPGTINNTSNINGVVGDTHFSVDRGFYDTPFSVVITSDTPGAEIRYTLNGSAPTQATGLLYTAPITIDKTSTLRVQAFKTGWTSSGIDTQTYIFVNDVVTQSLNGAAPNVGGTQWPAGSVNGQILNYGMDPNIVNVAPWKDEIKADLKAIPSINIAIDVNDMFGATNGIFTHAGSDGMAWERPASIEFIYPDGTPGAQVNAGIRIRGGYSSSGDNPKHAFRLFFRQQYGDSKFKFPIFGTCDQWLAKHPWAPGEEVCPTDEFDSLDLRTFQNYSWSFGGDPNGIFMRDVLARDMQLAQGQQASHGEYYHLYIDGQYWGIYNTDERPEAAFSASYFGGDKEDYDAVKPACGGCAIFATDGDLNAWQELWTQAKAGLTTVAAYQKIQGNNPDGTRNPNYPILLDVDNLIDYMLGILHGGNLDAPITWFGGNNVINNWFGTRPRDGSHGFRFFMHDSEHTILPFNAASFDRTGPYPAGDTFDQSNPQWLWQQLGGAGVSIGTDEFRLRVADHIRAQFFDNGPLTTAQVLARFDARKLELDKAVVGESARWGDSKTEPPLTRNTWLGAVSSARNYLNTRSTTVFNQLVADGQYPKLTNGTIFNAPNFNQYGGAIGNNFSLIITNPNGFGGTIYYTLDGTDPRAIGGAISPTALTYSGAIPLNTSLQPRARIRYDNGGIIRWSALTTAKFKYNLSALHVTEMMYSPAPPPSGPYIADDFEYIELQNTGNQTLQLGGIHFDEGITFTFPTNGPITSLAPGARVLVVKNKAAFESRYGLGLPIAGEFIGAAGGTLSNNGEDINIRGPVNEQLIHFNYEQDWYPITNGGGYSLVVRDPTAGQIPTPQDPDNPLSKGSRWRPSNLTGGAPGAADPGINPESIVINEAMSNSTAPTGDWIELKNISNSPINIGGWFLSNDGLNLTKYRIASDTILLANDFILFNAQSHFGTPGNPGVNVPFTLDEVNGAQIYLTNNDGSGNVAGYREFADFGASSPDVSFGRYVKSTGATDFTQLNTPTPLANNGTPVVGSIVISEVNYNPNAGDSEFIELENITDFPVQLWDPANPNNTWKIITGVDFTFPTNTTIPGFGSIILIPQTISISAFRTQYSVPQEVQIFQYAGALDNSGEDLKLAKPLPPVGPTVPYMLVDKVKYGDTTPWPMPPDGTGPTLQRVQPSSYGNDPANWKTGPNHGNPGVVTAPQRPPVVNAGSDGTVIAGVQFTSQGSFTDVNAEQTFSGAVSWGDGTSQPLTINPNKTYNFSHIYSTTGTFTVTVTITDSFPENGADTMQVTVTPSSPPVVSAGVDATIVQGDTFTQSGSFTDPDNGQSWTATVDWGDGAGDVPLTLNPDKTFNLNYLYPNLGNYTVTVTVKDNVAVLGTDTLTVSTTPNTVPAVSGGPDQILPQGLSGANFNATGSFTDPNAQQNWSATIDWGDGSGTSPVTINPDKTFNASHIYANPGTFNATITVTDSAGGSGVDTIVVSVTPAPRAGTADSDTYMLRIDPAAPGMIQFFENRTVAQGPSYVLASNLSFSYTFNGVGGDDTLIIDTTFGNPIPSGGVNFNGGVQGAAGDMVQVIGGSANDSVIIRSTQIQVGSLNITYGGTEQVRFDGNAGNDTLTINNFLNFTPTFIGGTGSNTLALNAGEYDFTNDAADSTPDLNLVANNSAIFGFLTTQHFGSLTLNGSSSAFVFPGAAAVIVTNALTMAAGATLDLTDNDLIVQATAANRQAMLAALSVLLRTGRNGGTWDGPGVNSSTAAADANHLTGLAAILNDNGDGTVVRPTFGGETVNTNSILVRYTYNGDANEDGVLNADDYAHIDAGFASQATGYLNGDFNFSGGAPNADDYFLIDRTFADQGAPLGEAATPVAPAAAEVIQRTRIQPLRGHKLKKPHKARHHHRRLERPAMDVLMPWLRR
jgi:hypothetical protein